MATQDSCVPIRSLPPLLQSMQPKAEMQTKIIAGSWRHVHEYESWERHFEFQHDQDQYACARDSQAFLSQSFLNIDRQCHKKIRDAEDHNQSRLIRQYSPY